jgi:hypothetical protein
MRVLIPLIRASGRFRDRGRTESPRRPIEGEDELFAVAVLEIAVVQPEVVGVPEARRLATSPVVVVVRSEDGPDVAGVLSPHSEPLRS